jgi:hypothetical protein
MYDIKTLKATPELARNLIRFSKLNNMAISDDLKGLATEGLLTIENFANAPTMPSEAQIQAIQFIVDWKYRSVILYNNNDGKDTALLTALQNNEYPIMIMTRTEKFSEWASFTTKIFPNKNINIFPYIKTKEKIPNNHCTSLKPECGFDVYITNSISAIKNDMFDTIQPKIIICDEFEGIKSFGYSNINYISGLLKEFKKVLILQNICFLAHEKMDMNTLLNFSFMNRNNHHLAQIVSNIIIPDNNILMNLDDNSEDILLKYYDKFDNSLFLQLFGVSSHLIYNEERTSSVISLRFYNDSISKLNNLPNKNKVKSVLRNHLQKEQEIEKLTRKKINEVMNNVINGSINDYAMNELYTKEWCDLKYKEIARLFLNNYSNSSKRMLFVATNSTLVNTFTTNTPKIIHYETSKSRMKALEQYIGEESEPIDFFNQDARFMIMSPNSMVNEDILYRTNYMVMAQYPTKIEDFKKIIEVCEKYKIILVDIVLQGSFEEYLVDILYKKLNI